MKLSEIISSYRSLADALESSGTTSFPNLPESMLSGESATGAAAFLCYLRDLITASPKILWTTGEILVLLEICSRDPEIFPSGIAQLMWDAQDEKEERTNK